MLTDIGWHGISCRSSYLLPSTHWTSWPGQMFLYPVINYRICPEVQRKSCVSFLCQLWLWLSVSYWEWWGLMLQDFLKICRHEGLLLAGLWKVYWNCTQIYLLNESCPGPVILMLASRQVRTQTCVSTLVTNSCGVSNLNCVLFRHPELFPRSAL